MKINEMIELMKAHSDYSKMGMIASHLGVVRETSLNGNEVQGIAVEFDQAKIMTIINEIKTLPGIIDVLVETYAGQLKVGDDIMAVVVGGDTREHVFPALIDTVNRIKTEASKKKEKI